MPSTPKRQARESRPPRRRLPLAFLALGALVLLLPQAFSSALFTSKSTKNSVSVGSAVDWTPPTVVLNNPGDGIRGTVTISATATDAETGIKNVAFSYRLFDPQGAWVPICTDTSPPYSCPFNTTTLAEDDYDIRAVATDNSNFTAEDIEEAVMIDNTAPTGSLPAIGSPISGVITIPVTAADAGSGVANVVLQRASTLAPTTWTTVCTDIDLPYSCRFDSTQVVDGLYNFRAIVTDVAGNTFTTNSVNNRAVSNVASSTSVDDPGSYLRGTVTITANGNATLGVASIRIQRAPNGTTTWTDICTDNSSPYGCSWNTATVPDGLYIFRSVMTDTVGTVTTSATVGPSQVDNTVVRGSDVQTTTGGSAGKLSANDIITLTYSRQMKLTSILPGWTGTTMNVAARLRDGISLGLTGNDDSVDFFTTTSLGTQINLGSVNLKGNYIKNNKVAVFNATISQTTVTINGTPSTVVNVTLGTVASGGSLRSVSAKLNMVWTPSALATDTLNNATSTAPATETGTLDRDF